MDKAENDRGVCPTCGLTMSMFHPDHAADTVRVKVFSLIYQTMVKHDAEVGDDWTFGSHAEAVMNALEASGLLLIDGDG